MKNYLFVLLLLPFLGSVGCSVRDRSMRQVTQKLDQAGYRTHWEAQLALSKEDHLDRAYLVDDNLYALTAKGAVYAMDAETGFIRWRFAVDDPKDQVFPPTHVKSSDGTSYCLLVTSRMTHLINRYNGDEVKSFLPPFAAGSSGVGEQSVLYIGGSDGQMHALKWQHGFAFNRPLALWQAMAGGPISATPVLFGPGLLYYASQNGSIFCCQASEALRIWSRHVENAVVADPVVRDDGVYVASTDHSLYRFHSWTGETLWRFRFQEPLTQTPVRVRDLCLQYCDTVGITAIGVEQGVERWTVREGAAFLADDGRRFALLGADGAIILVDPETGREEARMAVPVSALPVVNTWDDRVILAIPDGRVACLRSETMPYLKKYQAEAARARLHVPPAVDAPEPAPTPTALTSSKRQDPFRSQLDP